ncbi:MAG: hypothetical protein Q4D61_06805 [Cardiobacteriaceae bacterium]|nr:hypothetical protein [Cardiobacteriaceae bacterium]
MTTLDPALEALRKQIREQSANDPHIAAKIAAQALLERTFAILNDGKGVHVESAFAILGSLAGQASLQSALAQIADKKPLDENDALITVTDKQGRNYYYGNPINRPLLEDRLSLWSLVCGAVQGHGGALPDIGDIVKHVAQSIGTPQFGIPRLPEGVEIRFPPQECLRLWQPLKAEILDVLPVPARDWPLAYGLAIQQLIDQGKDVLPPTTAAVIVMECAVPMSKILPPNKL